MTGHIKANSRPFSGQWVAVDGKIKAQEFGTAKPAHIDYPREDSAALPMQRFRLLGNS